MTTKHLTPERRKEIARAAVRARHDPNRAKHCAATGLRFTTKNTRVDHPEYTPNPICRIAAKMLSGVTRRQFEQICALVAGLNPPVRPVPKSKVSVDLLRSSRAVNSGE